MHKINFVSEKFPKENKALITANHLFKKFSMANIKMESDVFKIPPTDSLKRNYNHKKTTHFLSDSRPCSIC